jgi:hypothetical protein
MPLEIKELQISVTINQQQAPGGAAATSNNQDAGNDNKEMLQHCIEDVIKIINSKKER